MSDRQATSAFMLLGMLTTRDWSAYELAEQVSKGLDQVWPRATRQRYNTLKKLVDEGWVTSRTEATGQRERSVYSITEAGRRSLAEWLSTDSNPPTIEFEGLVRTILSDSGSINDLRTTLEATITQAEESLALFASHAGVLAADGGTFPERQHLLALANRFMIGHYEHIIEWARWTLEEIATWTDTTSTATDKEAVLGYLRPGLDLLGDDRSH